MPDDLLTTVRAWLRKLDTRLIASKQPETDTLAVILEDLPCTVVDWLRALLARCEAAEGCDGNCSCVVMSRHEWQRAYSEERLKREAVEAAFREGWTWLEPYCESADGAWLASEARRKVGI